MCSFNKAPKLRRKGGAMSTSSGLFLGLALLSAVVVAIRLVECQEQLNVESRQQKNNDELADTIKYLETLDKLYSQMARPRFGRSGLQFDSNRRQLGGRWPLVGLQPASGHYESPSALIELLASTSNRPIASAAKYRDY